MNSALGKSILALVRDGDYAHAGEEEAIRLTLDPIPRRAEQCILDAGCGRGGTAHYVQDAGWGRVSGFDIEGESIRRAQTLHPDLTFVACDVLDAASHFDSSFDLIYAFNAYYAFPDQPGALRALRSIAKPDARLVIFEYTDRGGFPQSDFMCMKEAAHWRPIQLEAFGKLLKETGWREDEVKLMDAEYERWYTALVKRIEAKREAIVALAGEEAYHHTHLVYQSLLDAVRQKVLGGAIIYASALETK
jgi:SAM-dependent methyltransferase